MKSNRTKIPKPNSAVQPVADSVSGNGQEYSSGLAVNAQFNSPFIQRSINEHEDVIQRKGKVEVSANIQSGINNSKGGGTKLDAHTNQFMSSKFGTDFSNVKIHNNSRAHYLAENINAKAFTVGENIYFNRNEYNPSSHQGRKLLAHELTHTIQQKKGLTNDIQPFLYRKEKVYSGSIKIGPGIIMRWKGKKVTINANMEIYGPDGSKKNASAIEKDIRKRWNNKFPDGYEIKTNVSVTARAAGASAAANKTLIWVGPMTAPSNVKRGWVVGARYMSLDKKDLVWVPAHEFGHLLGLGDRYSESFVSKVKGQFGYQRTVKQDPGWEGNIMAVHGGVLESKNVKNLLDNYAYRVVTIVEDGLNSAAREIGKYERAMKRGWVPRL
jgi:hypothetical protein